MLICLLFKFVFFKHHPIHHHDSLSQIINDTIGPTVLDESVCDSNESLSDKKEDERCIPHIVDMRREEDNNIVDDVPISVPQQLTEPNTSNGIVAKGMPIADIS